jgi:hypothetical protein
MDREGIAPGPGRPCVDHVALHLRNLSLVRGGSPPREGAR